MTSRVSFLKEMKETFRRQIGMVFVSVLCSLFYVVFFFLSLQNILAQSVTHGNMINSITFFNEEILPLFEPNIVYGIASAGLGILFAYTFFRYLHSKKEIDFYDSLPIKRERRFAVNSLCAISMFLVLVIITNCINLLIAFGYGCGSGKVVIAAIWNVVCMLLAFLVSFTTALFVIIFTGHGIISLLGYGLITVYIPVVIYYLIPVYAAYFFDTYVFPNMSNMAYYFSPATLIYKMSNTYYYNGNVWALSSHWQYMVASLIYILIFGLLSYFLFKKRPSESAGRAMSFEKFNVVLRYLVVIPAALYSGMFFACVASVGPFIWMLFGVVLASVLMHAIMEAIFHFDIKAIFKQKKHLLIGLSFSILFVLFFAFDVIKFDDYMPNKDSIASIEMNDYLFGFEKNDGEYNDGMTGECIDLVLKSVEEIKLSSNPSGENYNYYNDFTIVYHLKNGLTLKRSYNYYGNELPKSFVKLSSMEDYKNDYCMLYHYEDIEGFDFKFTNGLDIVDHKMDEGKRKEFLNIYLEEYSKLSLEDSTNQFIIYEIVINYPITQKDIMREKSYPVYESFKNTIALIEATGFKSFQEDTNIELMNLQIYSKEYNPYYISDEETLNSLRHCMYLRNYIYNDFAIYNSSDDEVYCDLKCIVNGNERYVDVYIPKKELEQYIK